MKLTISLLFLLILSGCSATGPKYSEYQSSVLAIDKDSSRLFFYRRKRFSSNGIDAEIYVNDNKVGECANGAYFYTDVLAGNNEIKVENLLSPGTHKIKRNLKGGKEYYFEVLVDDDYVEAGILLGPLAQALYISGKKNMSGWIFKQVPKRRAVSMLESKIFSLDGE